MTYSPKNLDLKGNAKQCKKSKNTNVGPLITCED